MLSSKRLLQLAYALALLSAVLVLTTPGDTRGQQFRPRFPSNPGSPMPNIVIKIPPYKASDLTLNNSAINNNTQNNNNNNNQNNGNGNGFNNNNGNGGNFEVGRERRMERERREGRRRREGGGRGGRRRG